MKSISNIYNNGCSFFVVAVYKDDIKLLTNEFKGVPTVKTSEQSEARLEHKDPGGGIHHVN